MNDTADSNTLDVQPAASGDGDDAGDSSSVVRDAGTCWPNAALTRPGVVVAEQGVMPVAHAASLDWAVATIAAAWRAALNRPLSLIGTTDVAAANQSDHSFGVVAAFKESGIEVLVSFDATSVRSMVNSLTSDLAGLISTNAPGPIAQSTGTERGIVEYLSLLAFDRVLKQTQLTGPGPTIDSFLDGAQIGRWLEKHETRSVPLQLNTAGESGFVRFFVSGWTDQQWSPVFAIAPQLGHTAAEVELLDVQLALPAMSMQPEELASIEVGDVVLLGVSEMLSLSHQCELVTATHWKIATASITEDTPTYINVDVRPCTPTLCASASDVTLIRPLVGATQLPLKDLAGCASLQLSKATSTPVTLLAGPTPIAKGELVILGRELAIRVVQMIGN